MLLYTPSSFVYTRATSMRVYARIISLSGRGTLYIYMYTNVCVHLLVRMNIYMHVCKYDGRFTYFAFYQSTRRVVVNYYLFASRERPAFERRFLEIENAHTTP